MLLDILSGLLSIERTGTRIDSQPKLNGSMRVEPAQHQFITQETSFQTHSGKTTMYFLGIREFAEDTWPHGID